MTKKFIFLFLAGLLLIKCEVNSGRQTTGKQNLREIIKGVWWVVEKDTTYTEVLISDKIWWLFDENPGIIYMNYELTDDNQLKRYYYGTNDLRSSNQIRKFNHDTLWIVNSQNFEFVYIRLNSSLNIERIIAEDSGAANDYINGYRLRKRTWEEKNRTNGPK